MSSQERSQNRHPCPYTIQRHRIRRRSTIQRHRVRIIVKKTGSNNATQLNAPPATFTRSSSLSSDSKFSSSSLLNFSIRSDCWQIDFDLFCCSVYKVSCLIISYLLSMLLPQKNSTHLPAYSVYQRLPEIFQALCAGTFPPLHIIACSWISQHVPRGFLHPEYD